MALIDTTRQVRLSEPPFEVLRTELALEGHLRHEHLHLALPTRMIGDYGGQAGVTDVALRTAFDRLRRVARIDMFDAVDVWARRFGVGFARLHAMVLDGVFEQESEGERRLFNDVLAKAGMPPDCQVWMTPRIRVDFAYLFAGQVLEYHGEEAHRDRVDADSTRQFALRQLGQDVLVVTKTMVTDPNLLPYIIELQRRGAEDIAAGRRPAPRPLLDRPRLFPLRTLP